MATINGTNRPDKITPTDVSPGVTGGYPSDAPDIIKGFEGNDAIWSAGGSDTVLGQDGDDHLHGQDGNDYLYGEAGNDWLYGGINNDHLYGGINNDHLYGGANNDFLHGGDNDDYLSGGSGGRDIYEYRFDPNLSVREGVRPDGLDGNDEIADFTWRSGGEQDTLRLDASGVVNAAQENALMTNLNEIRFTQNQNYGLITFMDNDVHIRGNTFGIADIGDIGGPGVGNHTLQALEDHLHMMQGADPWWNYIDIV